MKVDLCSYELAQKFGLVYDGISELDEHRYCTCHMFKFHGQVIYEYDRYRDEEDVDTAFTRVGDKVLLAIGKMAAGLVE